MHVVKTLFNLASSVLWVTSGGLLNGRKPGYSLLGVTKSIMKAQPALRLSSIDVDSDDNDYHRSTRLILRHEICSSDGFGGNLDDRFMISNAVVYGSRYVLDDNANNDLARQLKHDPKMLEIKDNLELTFQQAGRIKSFYFEEKPVASFLESNKVRLRDVAYALSQREAAISRNTRVAAHLSIVCSSSGVCWESIWKVRVRAKSGRLDVRSLTYCDITHCRDLIPRDLRCFGAPNYLTQQNLSADWRSLVDSQSSRRGGVSIRSNVDRATKQAKTPIRGVMQSATTVMVR
jgi:hypothetical protein